MPLRESLNVEIVQHEFLKIFCGRLSFSLQELGENGVGAVGSSVNVKVEGASLGYDSYLLAVVHRKIFDLTSFYEKDYIT